MSDQGKGSLPFSDIYRGTKSLERVCKHTDSTHQENTVICMTTWVFVEDTLTKQESTQHIAICAVTHRNALRITDVCRPIIINLSKSVS